MSMIIQASKATLDNAIADTVQRVQYPDLNINESSKELI